MRLLTYPCLTVLALMMVASRLSAQQATSAGPEFTNQALLVVNFTPPTMADLKLGRQAGDAVRSRMSRFAKKTGLQVIDGDLIDTQLRHAGYDPDASFSLYDMLAVGRYLRTDEYIVGRVSREPAGLRLSGDLMLLRDVHFRQPLPDAVAPSLDSAAQLFAQSIAGARKQLVPQRRCENDLREGHPAEAVVAAREGVATYARSTLARTCLVVALSVSRAPAKDVLSTAEQVIAIDSGNTYALEAAANALDALHRQADAAAMWVRLDDTDSASADLGLRVTAGLFDGGNAKVAEPIIVRLSAAYPTDMRLVERRWRIAYRNENWAGAIDAGEQMLARDTVVKNDSEFVYELAAVYHAANKPYRAIATLAQGVAAYPGDAQLYSMYSQYIRAEADTVVPRGLALFPQSAELLAMDAKELRAKGKIAESLDATKKAVALDSTISNGRLAIAQLEIEVGHMDTALVALHRALGGGSDTSLVAQFALAEGNTLYHAASGTKTSRDFGLAYRFLTFADSLHSSSQSRFLVGAAAMGIAQTAVIEATKVADKTESCRLTQLGADMVPVARSGLQAGDGDLADAAKQSLDFLQQFDPYVGQQLKTRCPAP